ncbi:7TM-DISM domain-containing protein [Polynucleobacter necessarius]|uniref:7TMR-DISMED2 domain-containing protein n=1 Tax=Polynucleobacter necessarius TaxID=576610 RepID=UPI0013B062A2|nr:7TM-DISM domain-containing protein [Polynucleobacter necessarius]
MHTEELFQNFLLLIALTTGCANASDSYLLGQAYFEDLSNSLDVQDVKKEKFISYKGWLSKGYRPSTYWIRSDIRPSDKDLILRIRPAYVESIELFDSSTAQGNRMTGAKYPVSEADIEAFNHNFNLGADKRERQVYLKVKSVRTYVLNFQVMPLVEFLSVEQTNSLIFVAYAVFTFSLALWLLGAWFANREIVLGLFVVQQFISFLHAIFLLGYARVFLITMLINLFLIT